MFHFLHLREFIAINGYVVLQELLIGSRDEAHSRWFVTLIVLDFMSDMLVL